jgi:hypothetical protein
MGAPELLAVLFAIEVAAVPFLSRTTLAAWIVQIAVAVVCVVGLIAAAAAVAQRRRRMAAAAQPV